MQPIIFSEWTFVTGSLLKRRDFRYRFLVDKSNSSDHVNDLGNFSVIDEELLTRIKKRSQEESRADDKVFDKRLSIYKQSHNQIIESLSNDNEVINIDANDQIDSISHKIIEKLGLN